MIVTVVDVVDATEETLGADLGEAFGGGGGLLNVPGVSSETITTAGMRQSGIIKQDRFTGLQLRFPKAAYEAQEIQPGRGC